MIFYIQYSMKHLHPVHTQHSHSSQNVSPTCDWMSHIHIYYLSRPTQLRQIQSVNGTYEVEMTWMQDEKATYGEETGEGVFRVSAPPGSTSSTLFSFFGSQNAG